MNWWKRGNIRKIDSMGNKREVGKEAKGNRFSLTMKICYLNRIHRTWNFAKLSRQIEGNCRKVGFHTRPWRYSHSNRENNHAEARILSSRWELPKTPTITKGNRSFGTGSCFDISVFTAKKLRVRCSISRPILATAFLWSRMSFYYVRLTVQRRKLFP